LVISVITPLEYYDIYKLPLDVMMISKRLAKNPKLLESRAVLLMGRNLDVTVLILI